MRRTFYTGIVFWLAAAMAGCGTPISSTSIGEPPAALQVTTDVNAPRWNPFAGPPDANGRVEAVFRLPERPAGRLLFGQHQVQGHGCPAEVHPRLVFWLPALGLEPRPAEPHGPVAPRPAPGERIHVWLADANGCRQVNVSFWLYTDQAVDA